MNRKLASMMAYLAILLMLLIGGIWLFPLRERAIKSVAHEVKIHAQPSKRRIVNDQYLILTKKSDAELRAILDPLDLEASIPLLNWLLVSKKNQRGYKEILLSSAEAEDDRLVVRSLLENPHILAAEHNFALESALVPKNRFFNREWQFHKATPENPGGMDLRDAWNLTTGKKDIKLSVIDDFLVDNRFSFGERFSSCSSRVLFKAPYKTTTLKDFEASLPHGELMLLALGACANHKNYSSGMDFEAKLWAIQRMNNGFAQSFLSMLYASGIDVCQESLWPCKENFAHEAPTESADVVLLPFSTNAPELLHFTSDMISAAAERNVITAAASGNNNNLAKNFLPGMAPRVINVGAINKQGKRASFSNWGPSLDLLAPGDTIDFYYPNGKKLAQGTSIAAAYTAGALSLLKSVNNELGPETASFLLKDSSRPLPCDDYCENFLGQKEESCRELCCNNEDCGKNLLDAFKAVEQAKERVIKAPVIALDRHYALILRSQLAPARIMVRNLGDKEGEIRAIVWDENLKVEPSSFYLSPRTAADFQKELLFSFKREPFTRRTSKVELVTYSEGHIIDKTEVFIEYASKR